MKKYILIIVTGFLLFRTICAVRLYTAGQEAEHIQSEHPISTDYEASAAISSKKDLLAAIWNLAVWESETREALDKAYGFTDDDFTKPELKSGLESRDVLLNNALKEKWYKQRRSLSKTTEKCIKDWYDGLEIDPLDVLRLYEEGKFPQIVSVMNLMENNSEKEAYNAAKFNPKEEWTAFPMDIAYALRPELITAGCEDSLISAIEENEEYRLRQAIQNAENFQERYNVEIENLQKARKKKEQLEYANKPEIPKVGMSCSQACSTKIGPPTRTTSDSDMWSHTTHYFGVMYWERGDKMIFVAHYIDGKITDVSDMRNTKAAPNPWRKSSSSARSNSSFDPDDHDIEAYYEDNRDEYYDYDDAYEGFLDDEGVWDDY